MKICSLQNDFFKFTELQNKCALVLSPGFGDLFYRKCINISSHYACPGWVVGQGWRAKAIATEENREIEE